MDNNTNPNGNASSIDLDRVFGTAGRVIDTSKNVYDALTSGFNDSRRNLNGGGYQYGYGQPQQTQYPSYGYGYYDDNFGMTNMYHQSQPQMMSDSYPGISNQVYGKGGY